MKALIISQIVWLGLATGAYYIGKNESRSADEMAETRGAADPFDRSAGNSKSDHSGDDAGSRKKNSGSLVGRESADGERAGINAGGGIGEALATKDPIERKLKLLRLLADLKPEDVPGMLAAFEEAPRNGESDRDFRDFLYAWGKIDGKAALAYTMNDDAGRKVSYGAVQAMTGWASQDLPAAKSFLNEVEAGSEKQWLHYGIVKALASSNVAEAIAFAETNTRSRARGEAMNRIAETLFAAEGEAGLRRWLDGIDHTGENDMNSYKTYALRTSLDHVARVDPALAGEWLAEVAGQPFVDDNMMRSVAYRAANGNRTEALNWLTSLPDSKQRSEAINESVEQLADRNPNEAAAWLNSQPLGPEMDGAVYAFTRQITEDDPRAAIEWAGMIQSDNQREKAMIRAARQWVRRDPDAARAWVDRQSLSEEARRSILR